jgi:hypothetical protein
MKLRGSIFEMDQKDTEDKEGRWIQHNGRGKQFYICHIHQKLHLYELGIPSVKFVVVNSIALPVLAIEQYL